MKFLETRKSMKFFKKNRKDKNKVVEEEEGAGLYQPPNAQVEMKKYQTKYAEPGFANNPTARPGDGNGAYDVENVRNTKNYDNIEGSYAQMKEDEPDYLAINGEPVYVVKQKRGYLSILFSITQTVTLIGMMVQCNVAPLKINPMVGPYPDARKFLCLVVFILPWRDEHLYSNHHFKSILLGCEKRLQHYY